MYSSYFFQFRQILPETYVIGMELKSPGSNSPHSPSIALVGPRPRPLVLSFSSFDSPVGASRHIGLFCATHMVERGSSAALKWTSS